MTEAEQALRRVVSAALDQRNPSVALVKALNVYLRLADHKLALVKGGE